LSIGRLILLIIAALAVAALVWTGVWHIFTQFIWQYPMLSWLPLLGLIAVGFLLGSVRAMMRAGGTPSSTPPASPSQQIAAGGPGGLVVGGGPAAGAGDPAAGEGGATAEPAPSVITPVTPATTSRT